MMELGTLSRGDSPKGSAGTSSQVQPPRGFQSPPELLQVLFSQAFADANTAAVDRMPDWVKGSRVNLR